MRRVLGIALLAAVLATGSVLGGSAVAGTAGAASPRLGVVPGTWTIVASPNTAQNLNTLNGVSCLTSSFCMSVGNAGTTNPGQALIQQWNGTSWTILASPTVTGATASTLIGVSCVTTSYCVAVGTATVSGTPQTLVEQWNGTAWSVVTSPDTSPSIPNRLTAVSCTGLTVCTAVGTANNKSLALQWNGATWAIVPTATPSPTSVDFFSGVACKSASWCYAVGHTSAGGPVQPLAELWNGASWAVVATPNPTGGGGLAVSPARVPPSAWP